MQREIDTLRAAWLRAAPGTAPPPPSASAPAPLPAADFPSGPMSDDEGVEAQGVPTPRSAFGLFGADEPVGEWEEGQALSAREGEGV